MIITIARALRPFKLSKSKRSIERRFGLKDSHPHSQRQKLKSYYWTKPEKLVGRAGVEPATFALRVRC